MRLSPDTLLVPPPNSTNKPVLEVLHPPSPLNGAVAYDPDKELDYKKEIEHPASFDLNRIIHESDKVVDAQIMECDRAGRYRLASYDKNSLFERLSSAPVFTASPERPLTLREAVFEKYGKVLREDYYFDRDDSITSSGFSEPFANFTPLFIGPYYRQQYMYKMLEAKSKIYDAWVNNPVAHRIPLLITQFTLGKGVTVTTHDDITKDAWNKFATVNKIGTSMHSGLARAGSRLRMWSNQLSVDGESMFQFIETPENLLVKNLDTATILDIVTDPEDIEKVHYYHQQFTTRFMQYITDSTPSTKYIIRQIPGQDVLHYKINCYENEVRGRSDLFSVIGWIKRLKDLVNANVLRAYFQACYTYDVEVDGSPAMVSSLASAYKNHVPTPGAQYIHNKNIKRTPMPPVAGTGAGSDSDMVGLMNLISLGTGVPPAYLIGTMAANRAGVLTETEPSTKFFFERQCVWDEIFHGFFDRLARWHYSRTGQMLDENIEFTFPAVNTIEKMSLIQSLTLMRDAEWFSDDRCAEIAAKEWNVTAYNLENEREKIMEEKKRKVQDAMEVKQAESAAQSRLSFYQDMLADASAKATQEQFGYDPQTGQSAETMQAQQQQEQAGQQQQQQMQGEKHGMAMQSQANKLKQTGEAHKQKLKHNEEQHKAKLKALKSKNAGGKIPPNAPRRPANKGGSNGVTGRVKTVNSAGRSSSGGLSEKERAQTRRNVSARGHD